MSLAPEHTGIGLRRHYTTPGSHPYDELAWELRDARISNWKDGAVAFEQLGVEFPVSWSVNATNIVAQKYFRGTVGRPEREHSLRQVIDRVADTIADWGAAGGYFVDADETETFRDELKHLLVTQKAAFNSPVWFNIGVKGVPQQASACQPWDAPVITPEGVVPIGRLVEENAIGRKVLDAHGVTQIVAVKHNGRKRVLRITTKSGHVVEVTPDHLVWRCSGSGTGRFVEAGSLRPDDRLEWHRALSWGDGEIDPRDISAAALAGWLQGGGFVGQYHHGTSRSLTIEFLTVTEAEHEWVLGHLDTVFPDAHRRIRDIVLQDPKLVGRRIRLYGEGLRPFVERWGLLARGTAMRAAPELFDAPLPVVAAYLRSVFQAEGDVSIRERAALVGLAMISTDLVRDLQLLLGRFGVFSRVLHKSDPRVDRHDTLELRVGPLPDRTRFAMEVGFIDPAKSERLADSLELKGTTERLVKQLEIASIDEIGEHDVYDIQTESGEYLSSNVRVHNCFILAVDDAMDSILNWYREEGIIFKGGSGAGVNLSRIRSSKELLKGGGTASGPVSFMRGADASAGTIKSGGKTRRAAKMVILDAGHPDIGEFVWCKAKEERKARALRDAGFDMDLDGADSHSIQYQNANNSVRVTDEFMQSVVDDDDWELRAVTTGEVVERVRARDLWRQIAEAAWESADPGLQFDTTINRWHTATNTGRINASNPCSEYVHLDNSACNLASLNVLKFLRDGDEDAFDVEGFRHAVEVIFTAQEILVGNADYPTEKIAETTRAFRQLGLGYANLGALLMALGLPYDSDEGRAWAAAITGLMTGHAYATSARIASRMGPFAGFSDNEEHMLRVLRMHRDAAANIDEDKVPAEILSAAQQAWDEAVAAGEEFGVRNSQASVLAPTGTIGFMMDCDTTGIEPDLGLVKFKKLVGGGTMSIVNQTVPRALRRLGYSPAQIDDIVAYIDTNSTILGAPHLTAHHLPVFACSMGENVIHYEGHVRMMGAVQPFISGAISKCVVGETVLPTADGLVRIGSLHQGEKSDSFREEFIELASLGGYQKTDAFYYGGVRPVRRAVLRSGHHVTGTPNHRVLVATDAGFDWKRLDEIETGDHVAVQYGAELWSTVPTRFDDFRPSPRYGNQKSVQIPEEMTEDLAFLLGAYASEGCTLRRTWTVRITNSVPEVRSRVVEAWHTVFGVGARIADDGVRCPDVVVASKTIVEFLEYLGAGDRASAKRVPDAVLRSPRHVVLSFLDGLSLDAYATVRSAPKWAICLDSPGMLDDLQAVLTNLGIVHSRVHKFNKENGKTYGEVYATGRHAKALCRLVPFLEPDKAARAAELVALPWGNDGTADVVPIAPRMLHSMLPRAESGRNSTGRIRSDFSFLLDHRTRHVTRHTLERALVAGAVLPAWLHQVIHDELHFSPVESVDDAGVREVFDVSVPTTHAFVGNGIVNHNTVNMPEDVTVEDVEGINMLSWELGLKAVAIYRDNCKVGQPLSAGNGGEKDKAVDAAPVIVEKIVRLPVRERLPRTRSSKTFEFRVADCKGFVTVGEYADGRPGELFIRVSKQGSTLAGIMDAFAISISHGLQYGVPLRAFVETFTNMRFEPAGMTDDPDIRFASSILDYLFRRLALEYLSTGERAELAIFSIDERLQPTLPGVEETVTETRQGHDIVADPKTIPSASDLAGQLEAGVAAPPPATASRPRPSDAPICMTCGVTMHRAGSCYACPSCGSTSGCS